MISMAIIILIVIILRLVLFTIIVITIIIILLFLCRRLIHIPILIVILANSDGFLLLLHRVPLLAPCILPLTLALLLHQFLCFPLPLLLS